MKFLHSADWQLGAHYSQFGKHADRLRVARVETLKRTLVLANERGVDGLLMAGDLFEDSQVDARIVREVADLLAGQSTPVYILPGNHDPAGGPDTIWAREEWQGLPKHVTVFEEATRVKVGDGWLLAAPLYQKRSRQDPSRQLESLIDGIAPGVVKVGMTHGSPAVKGQHEPDDHPIDLQAATRLGLDYLALGHWHSWREEDGGRMLLPGTPEQDKWSTRDCGWVALVEIDGPGAMPRVTQENVATMKWHDLKFDCTQATPEMERLGLELKALEGESESVVLRIELQGELALENGGQVREWLDAVTAPFAIVQKVDASIDQLTAGEREALLAEHPMLAQAWASLESMEVLAGQGGGGGEPGLSQADREALLNEAKLESHDENEMANHLREGRRLFMQVLRECTK